MNGFTRFLFDRSAVIIHFAAIGAATGATRFSREQRARAYTYTSRTLLAWYYEQYRELSDTRIRTCNEDRSEERVETNNKLSRIGSQMVLQFVKEFWNPKQLSNGKT